MDAVSHSIAATFKINITRSVFSVTMENKKLAIKRWLSLPFAWIMLLINNIKFCFALFVLSFAYQRTERYSCVQILSRIQLLKDVSDVSYNLLTSRAEFFLRISARPQNSGIPKSVTVRTGTFHWSVVDPENKV